MTDVLIVGLGQMGRPMADRLAARADLTVRGHDADPAASAGERWELVADLADGVRAGSVVLLCLPTIDQVESVVDELLALPARPRCVIDTSTSDPDRTRAVASRLAEHGVAFADAPVARGPQAAADGTLLMMIGGPAALVDELRPLLASVASTIEHCGDVGAGQSVKILNNLVLLSNVRNLAEAAVLAEDHGLDPARVLPILAQGSAGSFALSGTAGQALAAGEFPEGGFGVSYALKDARLAESLAAGRTDLTGLRGLIDLLERAEAAGLGEHYYPAFIDVLRQAPQFARRAEPRLAPLPPAETAAAVTGRPVVAEFTPRRANLAVYRTLAHAPEVLNAWLPLCDHFLEAPELTPWEREVLILRTAHRCGSAYEWDIHALKARELGVDDAMLATIAGGRLDPAAPRADELDLLLTVVDELHETSTLGDSTWQRLRDRFDERRAVAVLMIVGQYHMLAFALNGAGLTGEPPAIREEAR